MLSAHVIIDIQDSGFLDILSNITDLFWSYLLYEVQPCGKINIHLCSDELKVLFQWTSLIIMLCISIYKCYSLFKDYWCCSVYLQKMFQIKVFLWLVDADISRKYGECNWMCQKCCYIWFYKLLNRTSVYFICLWKLLNKLSAHQRVSSHLDLLYNIYFSFSISFHFWPAT